MESTSGAAAGQEPVNGREQREPREHDSTPTATSTDASIAAAAQGSAVVSRPPRPPPRSPVESITQGRAPEQIGDGRRGTDGSSSAAAAVDRKGKKPISASDDREQAQRKEEEKSDSPKEKLLGSSIFSFLGHAKKKAFETLIEKIKGLKCKRMWEYPISIISYDRGKFLLKNFGSYDTANDSEKHLEPVFLQSHPTSCGA
ncbi:hypothetical protein E2562_004639 [Oryza meyeriana var. granulata]|uniref:Uncharacterized protein n=1 Tax=Oryza meyeriana var. granulata TaxID=110450 RepID=A0A6G1DFX7_9ORYZ|nr:hypothetical protein E2562_004639 [Oryza meyeriana var. granulata]